MTQISHFWPELSILTCTYQLLSMIQLTCGMSLNHSNLSKLTILVKFDPKVSKLTLFVNFEQFWTQPVNFCRWFSWHHGYHQNHQICQNWHFWHKMTTFDQIWPVWYRPVSLYTGLYTLAVLLTIYILHSKFKKIAENDKISEIARKLIKFDQFWSISGSPPDPELLNLSRQLAYSHVHDYVNFWAQPVPSRSPQINQNHSI